MEEKRPKEMTPMPERFKITQATLRQHGYTVGCPSCRFIQVHGRNKSNLDHTDVCRQRISQALMGTPEGRMKLEGYEERVNRALADRYA